MRVADRPLPPIVLHTDPGLDVWPIRPVVAIAGARPVEVYDDPLAVYDAAPLELEYDADVVPGFTDATCDVHGLETDTGHPDEGGNIAAGTAAVQLDNRTGAWSRYNSDGSLAGRGPGYELVIWALERDTGQTDPMFRGTITAWNDLGDTVEIEAFDAFSDLAQPIGTYTPGANGDTPAARLGAILTSAGKATIVHAFAPGAVTLTAQQTTAAPLDEMQTVVASDGGVLFADADGTLRSFARTWRAGRGDQTDFPVASANVCTADTVVWDAALSTNDSSAPDTVVLENVAHLHAQAPAGPLGRRVITDTGQQWTTQAEGDTLAGFLATTLAGARVRVESFDLYLTAPTDADLYRAAGWRLFDLLRWLHDYRAADGTLARLDVNTVIVSIGHNVTMGDSWVMTVETTPAVGSNTILVWNPPGDPYVWDTAGAVWGYQ